MLEFVFWLTVLEIQFFYFSRFNFSPLKAKKVVITSFIASMSFYSPLQTEEYRMQIKGEKSEGLCF